MWLFVSTGCMEIWASLQMFKSYLQTQTHTLSGLFIFIPHSPVEYFLFLKIPYTLSLVISDVNYRHASSYCIFICLWHNKMQKLCFLWKSQKFPTAPGFQKAAGEDTCLQSLTVPAPPPLHHMNLQSSPMKVFLLVQREWGRRHTVPYMTTHHDLAVDQHPWEACPNPASRPSQLAYESFVI